MTIAYLLNHRLTKNSWLVIADNLNEAMQIFMKNPFISEYLDADAIINETEKILVDDNNYLLISGNFCLTPMTKSKYPYPLGRK